MTTWLKGSELNSAQQAEVKRRFIYRFTREHIPGWVSNNPHFVYAMQFDSDADWLAHTDFAVNKDGSLNNRHSYCHSNPTWPDGKGKSMIGMQDAISTN